MRTRRWKPVVLAIEEPAQHGSERGSKSYDGIRPDFPPACHLATWACADGFPCVIQRNGFARLLFLPASGTATS